MAVLRRAEDRRCTHVTPEGVRCITRLCYLNLGPDCYVHSTLRRPAPPPRADQEQAAREEFERLMRQQEERISA